MISDFAAANRDGLTRTERMRAIYAVMDTNSFRSLIQEILDEIDQDAGIQGKSGDRFRRTKFQAVPASN
jgi:hypothetical protein